MAGVIDTLITYRILKLMVTPWERQEAFKRGIIDKNGNVLKKRKELKDRQDKKAYTILHRFVFNMKRILKRVGLGSRFGSFAAALAMVLREDKNLLLHKDAIEAGVITYLKETNQYEQLLNEVREIPDIDDEPVMTCLGIDIYEKNNQLVSEMDYEKL
jgi:hypothetical protein|tara:strand:- start:4984 stop:5457 length:474 start_codon:yes stop_codon:yes gene_type:complete